MNDNIKMHYVKRSSVRKIIDSLREPIRIFNLYKDKSLLYRFKMAFYCSSIFDPISDIYIKILNFFDNIKKVIEFLPYVWKHQDWDYNFIFKFNYYLHKRMYMKYYKDFDLSYYSFKTEKKHDLFKIERRHIHSAHRSWAKKLRTAMLLYKRLYENKYGEYIVNEIERRFGKEYLTAPFRSPIYEKIKKDKKYEKFIKDHSAFEENQLKQDLDLLHKLIVRYHKCWYD